MKKDWILNWRVQLKYVRRKNTTPLCMRDKQYQANKACNIINKEIIKGKDEAIHVMDAV